MIKRHNYIAVFDWPHASPRTAVRGSLPQRVHRAGFTLVELLVSVALITLIMVMMVQVFRVSTTLISAQKGLAENNQRARLFTTMMRADIGRRTFRDVIPFAPGQLTSVVGTPPGPATGYNGALRQGFFSISENDPLNPVDDVLHLSIDTQSDDLRFRGQPPLTGRATLLHLGAGAADDAYLVANPNQPEMDDGQMTRNNLGGSPAAEVVWFVRRGNLIRKQMLIRDSYNENPPGGRGGPSAARPCGHPVRHSERS